MFSLRILTVDSYQSSPICGYDDCYSDFRGCEIYNVPVLTIYGTTQAGQKGALHVHGVFPYLYLRWDDVFPGVSTANCRKYLQELALEIDKALNIEAAKSNSNRHHVHNIKIEKKRSIYGFYPEAEDFLKVLFYYPWDTSRVASLLYKQSILNKFIQPYEAHFPFSFQFLMDYNLFGMNTINVNAFKFRPPNGVDTSPLKRPWGMSNFLSEDSPSYCQIWNVASLSSSQLNTIPKRVKSDLEVDCREDAILNKYGLLHCMDGNPGLVEIKEDLKRQRRMLNDNSQMTPIPTQERDVEMTQSELFYKGLVMKIIENKRAAEGSLMNENDESDVINDSQRSFIQSSAESFGLYNTQDKEMLKMLVNMCKDHGPDDDSILFAKNDFESDDDEVTNEMSQHFVDDLSNPLWSSQNAESQYPVHSNDVFCNSMDAEIPSGSQQGVQIPQVDGAYDDETFDNGPRLLKQENVNVNTEFNEEPPVLHPIPPLETFEQDWKMHCSVKAEDVGTVDSSSPIPLTHLANGRNVRPKSKKRNMPVVKRSGFSETAQAKQVRKMKMTVDPSVEILLQDLISTVVKQENESVNNGSKVSDDYLQMDNMESLPKSDKTSKPKEDCFLGARPKTKNNAYSFLKKSSYMIKNSSTNKTFANNSESLSSKSVYLNDLVKTSQQDHFTDSSPMVSCSSFKHSSNLAPKVKNGEFKVHSKAQASTVCFDKKRNYELHPGSSNDKSSKESTSPSDVLTGIDYKSKKKDNYKENELSNSDFTKLKKSPINQSEFHSSRSESPCTQPPNSQLSFDVVKTIDRVNFSSFGNEAVLLHKLSEKDITKYKSGQSEKIPNFNLISEQIPDVIKSQKGMKNDRKRFKMFDRNKLKSGSLNQPDTLDPKESSEINSDSTINKEHLLSERHSDSIKNKKCFADTDQSGSVHVSSKKSISDYANPKKSKNKSFSLNNVATAFCSSEISDKKQLGFNKNSSFNNDVFLTSVDVHSSASKKPSSHHSTLSLINAEEPDDAIDFKNVIGSVARNRKNKKSSQTNDSSFTASAFISNSKPEFQKSPKPTGHQASSKHRHRKNDKNLGRRKEKKAKCDNCSSKKFNGKYGLVKSLECDKDFKKEPEAALKKLPERNVDSYPEDKATSPDIQPLVNSATKMLGSEPNVNSNVIKPRTASSLQETTVSSKMEEINSMFGNIIEKTPYVSLVDCKPLIAKYYPENLPLLLTKSKSLQSKVHKKFCRSKAFSESEAKNFHVSKKGGVISSAGCVNKNHVKRLQHKPKSDPFASSPVSQGKNQGYPKLNVWSVPVKLKGDMHKNYVEGLPIPGKSKSGIDLHADSQNILPYAVKSKPPQRSKNMKDLKTSNELSPRHGNQNIKKNKSVGKNDLHANNVPCELSLTETVNEGEEDKNPSKSPNPTFSGYIPKHTKKPSSNKNSKFRLNSHELVDSDCTIVCEVKAKETSKNKISLESKENHLREDKNDITTQCVANKDDEFKRSVTDTAIKDDCNFKFQVSVRNEQSDAVLEKATEVKPSRETCKPKTVSSHSLDNSIITPPDLYDTVKRRTASKNQLDSKLSLKPDSSKSLNNNKPGKVPPPNSRAKTSKKNPTSCRNDGSSVIDPKLDSKFSSVCEKEDLLPVLEGKDSTFVSKVKTVPDVENSVSVSKTEKLISLPYESECHIKQDPVLISTDVSTDSTSLSGPPKIVEETTLQSFENGQKSPVTPTSDEFLDTNNPFMRNTLHPIPESSNGNQSSLLPHTVSASGSHPCTNSKNVLLKSKGLQKSTQMSGPSNFCFFSSKPKNRRCQNDPEGMQFSKPTSSRLSRKRNKKNDFTNESKDSNSHQYFHKSCKIDSALLENTNSQGCSKFDSPETNSDIQSSEACVLPQNVVVKTEPPDDSEDNNRNHDKNDALKRFDFDESSSSDPASYAFSNLRRTQNKNQPTVQQPKPRRNAAKIQSSAHNFSSDFNAANKSDLHLGASSVSLFHNNSTNGRYPKRNRSVSSTDVGVHSTVDDDEVVILLENSRQTRKSTRLSSNNNPKEVIDLVKEDVCSNKVAVITIKRDSEGNNSIVPNKKDGSSTNNESRQSTSSSTYNSAVDTLDTFDSKNSAEDLSSSPDSESFKIKLKLKDIRRNKQYFEVVSQQLNGQSDQENESSLQSHSEVTIKTEEGSEMKSNTRRSSRRKSKASADAQIVPPVRIKVEKVDPGYDKNDKNATTFRVSSPSKNSTQTNRPSTSSEQRCGTLKLVLKSDKYCIESNDSNKRKLPNTTDESSDNRTEVINKRRRGRPAKVQKSVPPQNDLSPLKNNTSFNENLSAASSTYQINPGPSNADQHLDIGGSSLFPVSSNVKLYNKKVGPNSNIDWCTLEVVKTEKLSDPEDDDQVDNNINTKNITPSENNVSLITSRRRNSVNFKSFFAEDEDEDAKHKRGPKAQKKKTRSKSANTERNRKTVEHLSGIPFSSRRTRTRSGGVKNSCNVQKSGNASDSDCQVISEETPRKRGRPRGKCKKNRQSSSDSLPACNPCSVTLRRLSPSLLEQGNSSRKTRRMSNVESSNGPDLNSGPSNGIQIVPDFSSNLAPSCGIQNNESAVVIPPSVGDDLTEMKQQDLNSEKSDFEVLHSKVMGQKISPVLQPSPGKHSCPKFIPDSGPVTINGLNSIDIDSDFSELLCEKEMLGNKLNCSSFMYNSSLTPDGNILSNRNSASFLRPPSHEMDQRVFESPSSVLKNGNMDCQSPLLYSHSPITDVKHVSEFSPDNKFIHVNNSSPQTYKRQQELIHSPIMNPDPLFDHCNSPLKEVITANNKNENLKTPEKDFSRTMQQRDVNTYYSNSSDSYNEGCITDPSIIPKSKTKSKIFTNVASGIPDPLLANDFSKRQQHSSPYSFENNSVDHSGEHPFCTTKGYGNYDKFSNNQHDSLKYLGNDFSNRKESRTSCFPSNYSESRKSLPSILEQPAREESNRENSHYSRFPSSYGSPVGVSQQQQTYSTHNQNSFSNSFHQRTDESINSFRNNEYYDRMKWEDLNASNFSNTNDSFSEECKSPFSAQQNRYDRYYTKNNNDLSGSSRMNNDPYYRQKWTEVNASYYPHNDRSLNEFSQNDRSLDSFSLNDRSVNDNFRRNPPEVQPKSSKFDGSYPNINCQVSGSSGALDRTKSVDLNFSRFSTFDCNASEPKQFPPTIEKRFENSFDKNIDAIFNHHGFSSTSSEIQSPSPVSHASPQLRTNSSPFRVDSKIINKKTDFSSESNEAGSKYLEVCKPSPCSSLSDHLDSVQSPSVVNNSPLCAPHRPVSVIEEFKEIMEELSSPCIENVGEATKSPEVFSRKTQSPTNSREVLTISSDSGDAMSDCNAILKSPDSLSNNARTPSNECIQDVKTFDMTLDSVQEDTFDLLSDQMISDDESFLMDDNIFTNSPQNKVDESVPIPVGSNDNDACDIPKTTSTEKCSVQSMEANQTLPNYDDRNFQILNFQDTLSESDPFLGDLSFDILSQGSNSITNKENNSNTCVAATDVLVKDDLSDSAQIANETQNNNGCPLLVRTVPNVNAIVTNPPSPISDSPNSFVPLESLKNSIMPVITVNNSSVDDTVCHTQPSTTSAFNPINPAFLSTLMVNESVVLPQSNFFFNNGSIIIGDASSVEQGCINVFQNLDTDKNFSVTSVSEVDSKDSQEIQNLKKSFNGEDDILSMIVKSCDIGEEFDENFDSPAESLNNTEAAEPSSIHSASNGLDGASSNNNPTLETNSNPNSFSENRTEKATTSRNSPSDCEQKGETDVLSCELPNQINEHKSKENHSPSASSPSPSLKSSQDKDSNHESLPLDSMIHSFYGEDSLYGLNASGNYDSLSVYSSLQPFNVSLKEFKKKKLKSVTDDFSEIYNKHISFMSPSQPRGPPGNGNCTLLAETRFLPIKNGSIRQSLLKLNDKLRTKRAADFTLNEITKEGPQNMLVKPSGSPPHYIRVVFWVNRPRKEPKKLEEDFQDRKPGGGSSSCSSPESSSSQNSESPRVQPQPPSPSEKPSPQSSPNTVKRQLIFTPTSKTDHGVLRRLLSKGVTLESTPSVHRQYNKTRILDRLLLSPISKDNLLTNDTKRKRKLPFDGSPEQSELPESKISKEVHERSWKKSFMADQSKDNIGNLTSSEIDGPTLINSRDFRINIEDCERVRHEAQHLTIMNLEIHVNTRITLNPDPVHDPVAVIFYTIYDEKEDFQQKVIGIIAVDKQPEDSGLGSTHASLKNYLNMVPGVKISKVTCVENEKMLFEKLACIVKEWDPDLLVGYEIQMASWGYLIERANVLKINLTSMLSRLCSEKKETKAEQVLEDRTVTDQMAETDRINIPGRIVLNVWRLMRKEITLNGYTFENVYYHVLHKRTPKYSFHNLTQWYCGRQKEMVIRYYAVRVIGTIQILSKLDLIQRTCELARLFGIQFYEVLSRGSQFRVESTMRRTAAQMGFVCVSPSARQRSHSRAPEYVPLILEPLSRFYDWPIIVLDFQSLYPSIIISCNLCFSTCLGRIEHFGKDVPSEFGCTSLKVPLALLQKLVDEDKIHFLPSGIAFVKSNVRRGILPAMLEEILDTRVMVKQFMKKIKNINDLKQLLKQLDARQQGLKLLANTTYGYTGASFSGRMPCVEVADSVVAKARETLERAIHLIENTPKWSGAKVVYGDTDSLFVHLPGRSKAEAFKIGQEMADAVTKTNPKPVKLKFEKVYLPCVLQTKKRYVGFMYETADQKRPIFDAKGIETVRRDSCPATAKILEKSLKILFETHDVNSVKSYVQKQFRKVMSGRINLMDFIFAKEYRGLSGYRPGACVPALEIAKRRLNKDPRSEPRTGERVPYVVVYGLPGSPIIRLVHEPGDLLMNPSLRVNATYYITRVISPPLERVFSLMGANVKTWYTAIAHTQKLNLPMSHYPRETITQYFVTRNCPSCDRPTTSSLCDNCHQDPAGTAADLQIKIRKWERAVNHLNQICVSCTKSNSGVDHCASMECPVLFKLNLAKKDFSQAPYLRKILIHELF